MTITCPACGKANPEEPACARCGCDLTELRAVLTAAAHALETAKACLRAANWAAALDWTEASWQLHHTVETARLGFLAAGGAGDIASALLWQRRTDEDRPSRAAARASRAG